MARVPLKNTKLFARIDDSDLVRVEHLVWYLAKRGRISYAVAKCNQCCSKGTIYLHRLILNLTSNRDFVDHRDHDGLNCQKSNLRKVSKQQNQWGVRKQLGKCSSRYKGVSWSGNKNRWRASIQCNKKQKHLGYFSNESLAARAYDVAAKNAFGDFACVNFK